MRNFIVLLLTCTLTACAARGPLALTHRPDLAAECRTARTPDGRSLSIDWWTPADPSQGRALEQSCRSVGPPVVIAGTASTNAPVDRLIVVSWNTHVGGARLERFIGNLRSGMYSAGDPIRHFVLLVQEVYRADVTLPPVPRGVDVPRRIDGGLPNEQREAIIEVATRLKLWLYYVPSMRNGGAPSDGRLPEDRGNAIVSTLPLGRLGAIELPMASQRRVAGLATLHVPTRAGERRVRVVTTHLDASRGWKRLWFLGAARHRTSQAATLVDALATEPNAADAIVVGGDFNTTGGTAEGAYAIVRDAFPQTPRASTTVTLPSWRRRLDFLFFRLPLTWRAGYSVVADGDYGSDHRPLVGWLRFAE